MDGEVELGTVKEAAARVRMPCGATGRRQPMGTGEPLPQRAVTPPTGLKPIRQYLNANLDGFPRFMADRAAVERWKQTFALCFGEVKRDPSPGSLGLHPGA